MSALEDKIEKARALAAATVVALSDETEEAAERTTDKIVPLNILVTPEDRKRLRQLGLDEDTSLQKLGHEAWNMLLKSRGLEALTPVTANVPSGMRR